MVASIIILLIMVAVLEFQVSLAHKRIDALCTAVDNTIDILQKQVDMIKEMDDRVDTLESTSDMDVVYVTPEFDK